MRSCTVLEDEKVGCLIWEFYTGDRVFDGSGWRGGGGGGEKKMRLLILILRSSNNSSLTLIPKAILAALTPYCSS